MNKDMIAIRLFDDGTYTVEKSDSDIEMQFGIGFIGKKPHRVCICRKDNAKEGILELIKRQKEHAAKEIERLKQIKIDIEKFEKEILEGNFGLVEE